MMVRVHLLDDYELLDVRALMEELFTAGRCQTLNCEVLPGGQCAIVLPVPPGHPLCGVWAFLLRPHIGAAVASSACPCLIPSFFAVSPGPGLAMTLSLRRVDSISYAVWPLTPSLPECVHFPLRPRARTLRSPLPCQQQLARVCS